VILTDTAATEPTGAHSGASAVPAVHDSCSRVALGAAADRVPGADSPCCAHPRQEPWTPPETLRM
jgi:hypothetical protein